jgi:hypothetical protein
MAPILDRKPLSFFRKRETDNPRSDLFQIIAQTAGGGRDNLINFLLESEKRQRLFRDAMSSPRPSSPLPESFNTPPFRLFERRDPDLDLPESLPAQSFAQQNPSLFSKIIALRREAAFGETPPEQSFLQRDARQFLGERNAPT